MEVSTKLDKLRRLNSLTIRWLPVYKNILCEEDADIVVKAGAESCCGIGRNSERTRQRSMKWTGQIH